MVLMIAIGWALFGLLHSLLASTPARTLLVVWLGPQGFRLLYNALALITLLPCVFLTLKTSGTEVYAFPEAVQGGLVLIGLGLLWKGSEGYDLGAFLGLQPEPNGLAFGGLHRYLRHPWYLGLLCLLWSGPLNEGRFTTAIILTLYVFIGIYFEERKLQKRYGKAYADYQAKVPMLLPRPWRVLSIDDAHRLTTACQQQPEP